MGPVPLTTLNIKEVAFRIYDMVLESGGVSPIILNVFQRLADGGIERKTVGMEVVHRTNKELNLNPGLWGWGGSCFLLSVGYDFGGQVPLLLNNLLIGWQISLFCSDLLVRMGAGMGKGMKWMGLSTTCLLCSRLQLFCSPSRWTNSCMSARFWSLRFSARMWIKSNFIGVRAGYGLVQNATAHREFAMRLLVTLSPCLLF